MALSSPEVSDRLLALRANLIEERWASTVQGPVVGLFNELLRCATKLRPGDPILRSIEPVKPIIKPATLRVLVDQMLVALDD